MKVQPRRNKIKLEKLKYKIEQGKEGVEGASFLMIN